MTIDEACMGLLFDLPMPVQIGHVVALYYNESRSVVEFVAPDGRSHTLETTSLMDFRPDDFMDLLLDGCYMGMWPVSRLPWFPLVIATLIESEARYPVCGQLIMKEVHG